MRIWTRASPNALLTMDRDERYRQRTLPCNSEIADQSYSLFLYDQLEKHAFKTFVDWRPEENSRVMGYQIFAPFIGVDG